jgi:transposase-like protein
MRAFKILPVSRIKAANLSKDALKRLSWFDWHKTHGENISLTCRHFGISRDTFYLWKKRYNPRNLRCLEDDTKTRRPHRLREMTTDPKILQKIYDIRLADPEKSKYEIHEELVRCGIKVAHNVIQKVINRHYELRNVNHKKKVRSHKRRSIARIKASKELRNKYPGALIEIDTKHLYILGKRFYLFAAIDCKSRLGYIWAYKAGSSLSAADFLLKVIKHFPFTIKAVNTDNGSEYLLNFHKLTKALGIDHYFTYPNTPKMNPKVERFIQTTQYEFFHYQDDLLDDLDMINQRCEVFNDKYNNKRFHQALDYKTPKECVNEYLIKKGQTVRYV